ncbi:hypothetical protein OCH239_11415 [Roseivivax halodurans JCM 10272]|uniref:tRNA uridine(34) hydroxylase n=1 Tax=Roseivivax halodurans JCM 10272 TaxID=1449350 RepID=X7EIS5_9RHOB|nr:rhodanese-related sulfurtransferase [Roseivivax halodurans]ETX15785.1 hypothetical protein OCH239_11415 [Roseivivax halodurans JCM 10272]
MYTVAALYHFTPFPDPAALKPALEAVAREGEVTGTLLLATEGINGTIGGPEAGVARVIEHVRALPGCDDLEVKYSAASERPFARLKVRLKKEIVTLGQEGVDPRARTGHYVEPAEWTEFIRQPDVAVIDTRNDYEVAIGTFEGAVDPKTESFRDFPAWWEENKERFEGKRVAMFCTGGIRCEKSTNWLLAQGASEVYHLKGGILKYLEEVPEERSAWQGECFVFDGRVSVGHGLREGPHELCHACRRPILPGDRARPEFEEGVACHHCAAETSAEDKARFRERQRQIVLAQARGETHLARDAD